MPAKPTIQQIGQLPCYHQATIPSDYLDEMDHMNVMWYTHLFSRATRGLLERVGIDRPYLEQHEAGTFALEKHMRYISEVRVGEQVSVYTRVIDVRERRFHLLQFMVNDTHQRLASTMETVSAHVDLRQRRSSVMPAEILQEFRSFAESHARLDWQSPLCGVMGIR